MTNREVLEFSREAYQSLKSYHGTSEISDRSTFPEVIPPAVRLEEPDYPTELLSHSDAEIWFSAPDRLRVVGNMSRDASDSAADPFELVCDGTSTWSRWSCSDQEWEKEEGVDLAIGGFHGVSGGACTTIPRLLRGGRLSWDIRVDSGEAEVVEVAGHPAWRVHIVTEVGEVTHWVDRATGLLLRSDSTTDHVRLRESLSKMLQRMAADGHAVPEHYLTDNDGLGPTASETAEVFKVISINEALPASLFARPVGAQE